MKKLSNINKPMSNKDAKAFIQDMIDRGDPKLKSTKKPKTQKEVEALVKSQLALIKNNPKFREKLLGKSALDMQKQMNTKYGKDK